MSKNKYFTPHQKSETGLMSPNSGAGFIEWPEINFGEINDYYIENVTARNMYKGLIALLIIPEVILHAFYEVLRFKA